MLAPHSMPLRVALAAVFAAGMYAHSAWAGPPPDSRDEAVFVIAPEHEPALRELLAPVVRTAPEGLAWQGPRIDIDRVKWWLMRGEEARAILLLTPAGQQPDTQSEAGRARSSKSFIIEVAWAPGVDASAAELEQTEAAVAAIIAGDAGGFYRVAASNLYAGVFGPSEQTRAGPDSENPANYHYNRDPAPADPAQVRRAWGLKLGASLLLVCLAAGVTLRRRPEQTPA